MSDIIPRTETSQGCRPCLRNLWLPMPLLVLVLSLPLPNLEVLQVQAHLTTNGNGRCLESVNIGACPILFQLPSVRTFEAYQTDETP